MMITMGSIGDTMHEFEKKELKQVFPSSEGWRPGNAAGSGIRGSTYAFVRDLWVGHETVNVACMYDPVISADTVRYFRQRCQNGDTRAKNGIAILVPAGADVSAVPDGIHVIIMSSFGYEGEKLVWLNRKKNARKYQPAEPAVAQPPAEQQAQTTVS
jgi:hypothetical protein